MSEESHFPYEELDCVCPRCGTTVTIKWYKGVISDPKYILVADWVYHSSCWDKFLEENPL